MKIAIAGGTYEAEYIIRMFHTRGNRLIVINPSREQANLLSDRELVPVILGEPWKKYVLEEANAYDCDIFISLCEKDTDNYASCLLAKRSFGAKKVICLVQNPKNVDLYKRLGIDSVVSSCYLLGDVVKNESSLEDIVKAISLENNQVCMIEAVLLSKFAIVGKTLAEARFPKYAAISCIIRNNEVIIPNGQVVLKAKDKLMITCAPSDQKRITSFIKTELSEEELRVSMLSDEEKKAEGLLKEENPESPEEEEKPKKKGKKK